MDYNDFLSELTRQPARAALSPDDLETMGKRASALFLDRGMPLNEAIIKLAKECAGISQEQINRVVEFANRATFHASFDKQAGDKNVEFPIADSGEIIRHLNDSARGPVVKLAAQEYFRPPVRSVRESIEGDQRLEEMFKKASFENMSQQELTDPSAFAQELPATEQALTQGMEFADSALAMGRETGMLEGFQKSLDVVKSISKALEAPEMPQPPQGIDPTTMPAATDTTPMKMANFQDEYMGGPGSMLPYDPTAMGAMPPMDPIQAMQPLMGFQGPPQMAMDQSLLMGTPVQPLPLPGMGTPPQMGGMDPSMMGGGFDQFPKMGMERGTALMGTLLASGAIPGAIAGATANHERPVLGGLAGAAGGALGAIPGAMLGSKQVGGMNVRSGLGLPGSAGVGALLGGAAGALTRYANPQKPTEAPKPQGTADDTLEHEGTTWHAYGDGRSVMRLPSGAKEHAREFDHAGIQSAGGQMLIALPNGERRLIQAGQADDDTLNQIWADPRSTTVFHDPTRPGDFNDDLRSLESEKVASAHRTRQNIEKIAEELAEARDQNAHFISEAEAELNKLAFHHMFDGGSLGELAHCLQVMGDSAKGVFDHLIPKLASQFYDVPKLQAEVIRYEMEKGASVRAINPDHPIVKLATGLTRMRAVQVDLEKKAAEAKSLYNEALKVVGTREMTRVFE
jgi:hypothetical protein